MFKRFSRLAVVVAVLSLSACSTGRVFVDGGIAYADTATPDVVLRTYTLAPNQTGAVESGAFYETVRRNLSPYGRLTVGYEWTASQRVRAAFELSHQSSIEHGDRGVNSASVALRWYPF
jgi:hypothetical protein